MVGPAFTTKNLKGFSRIFQENVENLVKVIYTCKLILKKHFMNNSPVSN